MVVSDVDITPSLWIGIVCDFLVAYNARNVGAEPLLDALLPLYFGRTATFVREVADLTDEEAEAAVDAVADAAIGMKPSLIARWDAAAIPDRSLADQPVPDGEPLDEMAPGSV